MSAFRKVECQCGTFLCDEMMTAGGVVRIRCSGCGRRAWVISDGQRGPRVEYLDKAPSRVIRSGPDGEAAQNN